MMEKNAPELGSRSASQFFEEQRKAKIRWQRRHGKKARKLLRKGAQPNKDNFFTKLNSERIVSYDTIHELPRFSGSSFNRKLKLLYNEKERTQAEKIFKENEALLFPKLNGDTGGFGSLVENVHCTKESLSGTTRRVAGGVDRKKRGVYLLSPRSKAKIRAKITEFFAWCKRAKKQCTFLTLTFVAELSDRLAIKILNKFLTSVRQEVGAGFQYIRVAERQDNGNIHFHLILDRPINIIRFNSLWVLTQYNEGLVGYSKKFGRVIHKEEIVERHERTMVIYQEYKRARLLRDAKKLKTLTDELKHVAVGKLLNPVDIKKISSPGALAGYLTKYVTKNNAQFSCLAWSCSRGVSKMFTSAMVPHEVWVESISEKNSYISKEGELVQAEPWVDPKGMSVTVRIFNRPHFEQYLNEMRTVNQWILSGEIDLPDIPIYTRAEYMRYVHNFSWSKN